MFMGWSPSIGDLSGLNAEVTKNPNEDIKSGTILEWFISHRNENRDTFLVTGHYPDDAPESAEGYVEFKRGSNGNRTIVYFYPYDHNKAYYFKRTIFQNKWRDNWKKITFTYAD